MPEETTRAGSGTTDAAGAGEPGPVATSAVGGESAPADDTDVAATDSGAGGSGGARTKKTASGSGGDSMVLQTGRFIKELVIIVVIALVASALLRAFVIQAYFVPSGSMLPEIQLDDRILVSRIGDLQRGEVVVFEDPGGWIPAGEQARPPGTIRKGFEFVGVLPASGHEHLVKRVIGLPGDHVICCDKDGKMTINGKAVDESDFIMPGKKDADDTRFDVVVPKDRIFVLGDNRYVSGDSAKHIALGDPFVSTDLVTGRAFAVIWPFAHRHILRIPDAYDDVPDGQTPPEKGVIKSVTPREGG